VTLGSAQGQKINTINFGKRDGYLLANVK